MVSTLSGSTFCTTDGTGASASFAKPSGIAYDGIGNLYVTDFSTHRIRKILVATGAVTTFAGGYFNSGFLDGSLTSARFNKPIGIAADGSGFLYVADHGNHRIRKIDGRHVDDQRKTQVVQQLLRYGPRGYGDGRLHR